MRRIAWSLACLLGAFSAPAMPDDRYLAELIAEARQLRLAERPEWRNLLHYKPRLLLPGVKSLADDPAFFNAPHGKTDPAAELEATLAAFFVAEEETDKRQPAQCRFIARYHWLAGELGFDPARLQPAPCRRFHAWRQALNPHEVTLIFAAAYLNNPASMYGHTLLRVDARDQDERTRLLAYTFNYAANTDETSGIVFAVNGLLGGYAGQFSIGPYYLKVREYNDLENRDLWEYRLNLTPEEIDRMLRHLWELGPIYFDYYFFDENCSYHLLSLLEVARPGLELSDRFRWWAIPSDTVGAVVEQGGLLKEAVYRPAAATVLRHHLEHLEPRLHDPVRRLAQGRVAPHDPAVTELPETQQAAVLETAYEYAAYRRTRDAATARPAVERELLLARSRVPAASPFTPVPVPAVRPEQGHGSARLALGVTREAGENYLEIGLRPGSHDVLDPEAGYTRGAQIEFFALTLRHSFERDRTQLEEFRPVDVLSITPRDDFFDSWSWKINAGWARKRFADGRRPLVARANGGAGLAWGRREPRPAALAYVMLEATAEHDSEFEHDYALGFGPTLGALYDISPAWRASLVARTQRFGLGQLHSSHELVLAQRYTFARHDALRLDLARRGDFGVYVNRATLSWLKYF